MKIAKKQLKQIILEELELAGFANEGIFSKKMALEDKFYETGKQLVQIALALNRQIGRQGTKDPDLLAMTKKVHDSLKQILHIP
tara:strand:+ start:234 stop:485 length:252 start_codon:yes stop_codon:yes gene_type:complete